MKNEVVIPLQAFYSQKHRSTLTMLLKWSSWPLNWEYNCGYLVYCGFQLGRQKAFDLSSGDQDQLLVSPQSFEYKMVHQI